LEVERGERRESGYRRKRRWIRKGCSGLIREEKGGEYRR